jgi:hypothetical protein
MPERLLADLAFVRSGDKGDSSDVSVFAPDREVYALLAEQVTAERVRDLYGSLVEGDVVRYEVPNVLALKFVLTGALGGGGPASLRADNLGKAFGSAVLRLPVTVPDALDKRLAPRLRPPPDPYRGAEWLADSGTLRVSQTPT